jgi:6,7-dimethyl-8-ribityllumazine synthase
MEKKKNLSHVELAEDATLKGKKIGIVTAEWNEGITFALRDGAVAILKSQGWADDNIEVHYVPGAFELTTGAKWMAERVDIDAVITLGCVIQGETRHFDFICNACAHGITNVGLNFDKPVIFGVLTPNNQQQAIDRAGGQHGNKGIEAAETALKMLLLQNAFMKK